MKQKIGYHRRTQSNNSDEQQSPEVNCKRIKFDVDGVFLPTESLGADQFSDLKNNNCKLNQRKNLLKRLDLYSDEENDEPNIETISPQKDPFNDSVVRVSALRQSQQISEIFP